MTRSPDTRVRFGGEAAFTPRMAEMRHNWQSFWRKRSIAVMVIAIVTCAILVGCQPGTRRLTPTPDRQEPIRAIWVTRWDYGTAADIAKVMDNCRSAGFNTVLFQVRGNGTVFYRSMIEPWADELGGRDPGFDPLAVACKEAHRRGLSLHAWVNVMPGWHGDKLPMNRRQLYLARPEWFWYDAAGRRQPLGWYSSLNPCLPEVRRYLVGVMQEIVGRYPVDGLHLDYIRFPNERSVAYRQGTRVPDYPRDRRTLALYKRATGRTPETAPRQWDAWRTDSVTRIVRDIRAMMRKVNPRAKLSVAVGASPAESKRRHFQDSSGWIADGLLDAVYPMNYAQDTMTFNKRLMLWSKTRLRIPAVVGVMADKRSGALVVGQISRAVNRTGHFAVFAYNSLFERLDSAGRPKRDGQSASRAELRKRVIPHLRRLAAAQGRQKPSLASSR